MKNKNPMLKNRKTLGLLTLILLFSLTIFSLIFLRTTLNASASTIPNYDAYTNSDIYQVNGNSYLIRDYTGSHFAKEGHVYVSGGYQDEFKLDLNSDDAIVKIVPRELFTYENETLHIGNEYGFLFPQRRWQRLIISILR